MRILTAAEIKQAEENAVLAGTTYQELMERAGAQSAAEIVKLAELQNLQHTAILLCGKGNNAGDAFVVARHLAAANWRVQVVMLLEEEKLSTLARHNWLRLPPEVKQVAEEQADYTAAFIVDGVFGTGFSGKNLPSAVETAFKKANAAPGVRIALDIPSGLACDTGNVAQGTFHARYTFTFGAYKPGLITYGSKSYAGEIVLLDIGI